MPKKRYKTTEEHKKNLSKAHKGIKYPNRKKPLTFTDEHRNNIGKSLMGHKGYNTKPNSGSFKKGEHYSINTEFKKGMKIKPENHPSWKGGNSMTYMKKHPPRLRPEQCEVCGAFGNDTKRGICFDHDHKTGKFRGWICHRCNVALGMVKDNSETLIALANYLKNNG